MHGLAPECRGRDLEEHAQGYRHMLDIDGHGLVDRCVERTQEVNCAELHRIAVSKIAETRWA